MRVNLNEIKYRNIGGCEERNEARNRPRSCLKFCGCFLAALMMVLAIIALSVRFVFGPAMKKTNASELPKEFAVYNIESAEIMAQNQENKKRLLAAFKNVPDWALQPFWSYISDSLKMKMLEATGGSINIPEQFAIEDFKAALEKAELENSRLMKISWPDLDKTKESIAAYYKDELAKNGFEFRENLGDYKIDIGFWKDEIFGTMSFEDASNSARSRGGMIINYFQK